MHHRVGAFAGEDVAEKLSVANRPLREAKAGPSASGKGIDGALMPAEEVVHHDHVMPLIEEAKSRMGTNESGAAGDEDAHGESVASSARSTRVGSSLIGESNRQARAFPDSPRFPKWKTA